MNELIRSLWATQSRIERPAGGASDTVYMHGVITDEDRQEEYLRWYKEKRTISVASVLKQLGEVTASTVRLHVNSPGGNYFEGAAIRDALMADGRSMVAVGAGMVGSAATLPFLAASSRELSDGGLIFIHHPETIALFMGTAALIEKESNKLVRSLTAMANTAASIYSTATQGKVSAKRFLEYMDVETMFTPQEALDLGLVQRVITPESGGEQSQPTPTAKEVDVDKATMAKALGLPDDVSDADLEAAVIAMKQRDDAAQAVLSQQSAESVFDAAMAVPLAQGKITPAGVDELRKAYMAAENKDAMLSVQQATLAALAPNASFNTQAKGSGHDPTGQPGDPDKEGNEPEDLVARVQARIDKHKKAGMSVVQAMNAARAENREEFDQFRFSDTTVKDFHAKGAI